MNKTLFGKVLIMTLIVIMVVSGVSGILTNYFVKKYTLHYKQQEMIRLGQRVVNNLIRRNSMTESMSGGHNMMRSMQMRTMIAELEDVLGARIWTMDHEGRIYLETGPARQLNQAELEQLLLGKIVTKYDWNDELDQPILAVALPLQVNQTILGGLLVITPMKEVYDLQSRLRRIIVTSAWIGAAVAVILAFWFSRRVTKPIHAMQQLILRMRKGDFSGQVQVSSQDELGELARHFNELNRELDETIELLQTEKEQTRRIINSMAEGVISLNDAGQVVVSNPAANRLLNLPDTEFEIVAELYKLPGFEEQVNRVFGESKPIIQEIEYDSKILSSIISPICTTEDKQPVGVVIVLQDITNRWRLIQLQKELVANVSHEFKTPLTTIKGFAELMLDNKIHDTVVTKSSLEIIHRETRRLIKMVEGLLKMAHFEANRLRRDSIDLNILLQKVVESLSLKLQDVDVEIKLDILLNENINVDPDRMEQVFYNLLDNGIRFSPKHSEIIVTTREILCKDDRLVEIQIRDHGPGIPPAEQEMIFDRFYKVEKARTTNDSSSGLGLAIVREIIEEHGGRISAQNHPTGGAVFTIRLPLTT